MDIPHVLLQRIRSVHFLALWTRTSLGLVWVNLFSSFSQKMGLCVGFEVGGRALRIADQSTEDTDGGSVSGFQANRLKPAEQVSLLLP